MKPIQIIEDKFTITSIEQEKFENVTRVKGISAAYQLEISLDIQSNIFPVSTNQSLTMSIYDIEQTKLNIAATDDAQLQSVLNNYDYVVYGKIFSDNNNDNSKRTIYASFGGLLLSLTGDNVLLSELQLNKRFFLALKRVN